MGLSCKGSSNGRLRTGLLIDHPVHHFVPGFRLLAREPGLALRVYYWNATAHGAMDAAFGQHIQWKADVRSGYDWWAPREDCGIGRRGAAFLRQLRRDRPDVLLCFGWGSPAARLGILFSGITRTPLLYYSDAHPDYSASDRNRLLRELVLRALFRDAAGAISTGYANQQSYLHHGMARSRIHPGVLPADIDLFSAAANRRSRAGQVGRPVVIGCAGKFIGRKAVDDLVEAAGRLPMDQPWELWLIGDGPLRPALEHLVRTRCLEQRVRFLGFRNLDELPDLMAAVDVMVLPSRKDYRPVVVLEAMAAGAAVVISSATGLSGPGDLVVHGETGVVFPSGDIDALAGWLRRLATDDLLRARLAASGQARAQLFSPNGFASSAAAALTATARDHALLADA